MKKSLKNVLILATCLTAANAWQGSCYDCGKARAEGINRNAGNIIEGLTGGRLVSDLDEIKYCLSEKNKISGMQVRRQGSTKKIAGNAINNTNDEFADTLLQGDFCGESYRNKDKIADELCKWMRTVKDNGWFNYSTKSIGTCREGSGQDHAKLLDKTEKTISKIQECIREEDATKVSAANPNYRNAVVLMCDNGALKDDLKADWTLDQVQQLNGICEELKATKTSWYRNEKEWLYSGSTYPKFPEFDVSDTNVAASGKSTAADSSDVPAPKAGDNPSEAANPNDTSPKTEVNPKEVNEEKEAGTSKVEATETPKVGTN